MLFIAQNILKEGDIIIKRICEHCGKEFFTYPCQVKRGGGKFCSISCATTYRNIKNNPTLRKEVREKISKNHKDVSGENNPMYDKKGILAPSYIDGRNSYKGETYKKKAFANYEHKCSICGSKANLQVHHIDGNHNNNKLDNLVILCEHCHRNIAHTYIRNHLGQFSKVITNEIIKGDD